MKAAKQATNTAGSASTIKHMTKAKAAKAYRSVSGKLEQSRRYLAAN